MTDNAPEIRRMNLRSIRASIDFFKYLTVRGGRLIRNGNRYTLEVSGSGRVGGRWSGRVFWGGVRIMDDGLDQWALNPKTHLKVNLRTGATDFDDWNETDTTEIAENEYFSIATKTTDPGPPETTTYALNSHTVGDIHARIT